MSSSLRTIVEVNPFPFTMDFSTKALMLGSCFTHNMGEMMQHRKFPVLFNPFGVVYNPFSVHVVLKRIMDGKPYQSHELLQHNELWASFDHHSSFSHPEQETCLQNINIALNQANAHWRNTNILMLTFGTARAYIHRETNRLVANCHKIPAQEFEHKLFSVDEIVEIWREEFSTIFAQKPNLKVILTVSPVRHWKDGAHGNQLSKSTLLLAVNNLVELFPGKVFYFPSYEIVLDDLRDYRFFNADMLHPSAQAVEYVWEKFKNTLLSKETQNILARVERVVQAVNHRPIHRQTSEFKKFVQSTLKSIERLTVEIPQLDFTQEIELLNQYLC